jgi:hypothetical protein
MIHGSCLTIHESMSDSIMPPLLETKAFVTLGSLLEPHCRDFSAIDVREFWDRVPLAILDVRRTVGYLALSPDQPLVIEKHKWSLWAWILGTEPIAQEVSVPQPLPALLPGRSGLHNLGNTRFFKRGTNPFSIRGRL